MRFLQEGVSLDYGGERVIHRGGGVEWTDTLQTIRRANSCWEFCYYGMMPGGLSLVDLALNASISNASNASMSAHYLKCYDASAPMPLNSRRIAHDYQLGSDQIDSTLPVMNLFDWQACMRMHLLSNQ